MISEPDRQMTLFPERIKRFKRGSFAPRIPLERIEEGKWLYRGRVIELIESASRIHAQVVDGSATGSCASGLEAIYSAQQMIDLEEINP